MKQWSLRVGVALIGALGLISCGGVTAPLETVKNLQPEKYAGTWHEVARLPNFFQRDTVAAQAIYGEVEGSPAISVWNRGLKSDGSQIEIKGSASPRDENTPTKEAKLKVRFNRFPASLFAGDYWILDLNDAHTRAVVGTPSRKYLWLLSKNPNDQVSDFADALAKMKKQGFETDQLIVNPKRMK